MNGTPRLPSSFPSTPGSGGRGGNATGNTGPGGSPGGRNQISSPLPTVPQTTSTSASSSSPLIPVTLIDAPSQRMYTLAIYGLLLVWRLYDWWLLVEEDTTSIALFVKWACIDLVFLFGVPLLRIPWLEWTDTTSFSAYFLHAFINGMLMFRIPLPIEGWLLFLTKTLFDRELSISENSVRPASILHNSSLIMGKQIINILPEGSVTMNPDQLSFCIRGGHSTAEIPLRFNQTKPQHIEILRFDLETNANETITLSHKEMKNRIQLDGDVTVINYVTKRPGLYRLQKVIDRTKLEVQRRMSDTLVVTCPKGAIKSTTSTKCVGDLSDLTMEIEGTPPLKVVYSRTANKDRSIHHFQSIQPENFVSPLLGSNRASTIVPAGSQDVSWARAHRIRVPLNESMIPDGRWLYSIDEIHDAVGNVVNFSSVADDGEHAYPKRFRLEQEFVVHERPVVQLRKCDSRNPLMVPKGMPIHLPTRYNYDLYSLPGDPMPDDTSHTLTWKFSPLDSLTKTGDHGDEVVEEEYFAKGASHSPVIREPGLYTLTGVKSRFCEGEVQEPESCLLLNPPKPQLNISAQKIDDKCAGNPIGLLVDLDLIGTPPFLVRYDITKQQGSSKADVRSEHVIVPSLRHQIELKPENAGHYTYHFTSIDDSVYTDYILTGPGLVLEQDVKPPAVAFLRPSPGSLNLDACIEEPVEMEAFLHGEKPFTLEYELIFDGRKERQKVSGIEEGIYKIKTRPLLKGGEYSLALTSIQDQSGCKIFLNSEVKFTVRHQQPKASFGYLEGKHKTTEVERRPVGLPLRLTGAAPWTITYRNINDTDGSSKEKVARHANDFIFVNKRGTYEILDIYDDQCRGTVDRKASRFEVDWVPRPQIKVSDTAVLVPEGSTWLKREVCEGDIDAVEVQLTGTAPYNIKYQVRHRLDHRPRSVFNKELEAALGSATISMDTSKAGSYEYAFTELSDALYDHDKQFTPLVIKQKVNRKPSASFVKPGQSYKYCKEELAGDEVIPIRLEGSPPFSLEVDIKHQSSSRPETVKIANIEANNYEFRIPHRVLSLGIHQVSVRKVRDSRGCQQKTEYGGPHVQVQVYDVPTIHPSESRTDYCVGERISYSLSGAAPFEIFYTFDAVQRKAKSSGTTFRRIAEKPGNFTVTGVSDRASECRARTEITKLIHEMPSVKISKGRQVEVDIHEGGEVPILFEFWGTPPFEFTYTRSTNARKGQKSQVLETRREVSREHSKTIMSSQEGTYEVVAIKDKFCSFSTQKADNSARGGQKLLQF